MSRPEERLQALAADIQAGRAISDADARLVAHAVRTFTAEPSRGRDKLLRQEARRDRDEFMRELARQHCRHLMPNVSATAKQILTLARHYETTGWLPDEMHAATCPEHLLGKPEEFIWRALNAGAEIPGFRLLQEILSKS